MRSNQKSAVDLGTVAMFESRWEHEAQREIREKFLGMAKHLRSRPSTCRSPFDEAGGARQTPGWSLIRAGRACLSAARAKNDATLAATRVECRVLCDSLYATMVYGFEAADVAADIAIVECVREESEAQCALTEFALHRDAAAAAHAMREVSGAVAAGERVLTLGSRLTLPTQTRAVR